MGSVRAELTDLTTRKETEAGYVIRTRKIYEKNVAD
jgi:hypothetical protein